MTTTSSSSSSCWGVSVLSSVVVGWCLFQGAFFIQVEAAGKSKRLVNQPFQPLLRPQAQFQPIRITVTQLHGDNLWEGEFDGPQKIRDIKKKIKDGHRLTFVDLDRVLQDDTILHKDTKLFAKVFFNFFVLLNNI